MKTKIDLWDVTFNIILRLDSIERLENIIASITFLNRHFNTNVTVWECSYRDNGFLKKLLDNARVSYVFKQDDDPILFRTHYLNQMIQETTTPIVSIWDTDVIAPVNQIIYLGCKKQTLSILMISFSWIRQSLLETYILSQKI